MLTVTCDERRDAILLYAADALDGAERDELTAHLSGGCARCAGALAEARAVVASLAWTAEPRLAPPDDAAARLMSRLAEAGVAGAKPAPEIADYARPGAARARRAWRPGRLATALMAASVAALISGLSVWYAMHERARLPVAREVQYVAMRGGDTQPLASARIFWDTARHDWHIYFFDLKPLPPGRKYQVWLVTSDGARTSGGVFNVGANGRAEMDIPLPQDIGPLASAAVTDEPGPLGSPQPTGTIHLSAEVR